MNGRRSASALLVALVALAGAGAALGTLPGTTSPTGSKAATAKAAKQAASVSVSGPPAFTKGMRVIVALKDSALQTETATQLKSLPGTSTAASVSAKGLGGGNKNSNSDAGDAARARERQARGLAIKSLKSKILSDKRIGGGARAQRDLDALPLSVLTIDSPDAYNNLKANPNVGFVTADSKKVVKLTESLPLISQPAAVTRGYSGAGCSVAVIDTPGNYGVADLGSCTAASTPASCRVDTIMDFTGNGYNLTEGDHATNVGSTIARLATGARIHFLNVFSGGSAWDSDILAAINWAIANADSKSICSINLSLGDSSQNTAPCADSVYEKAFADARAAGIVPAVAAGNEYYSNALSSPACAPSAVSVGAVHDSNHGPYGTCDATTYADRVCCFSNVASFMTLLAPGCSTTAGGFSMCGTSMATPHVAGAAAILRAASKSLGAAQSVNRTVAALKSGGTSVSDWFTGLTFPRINVNASVTAILKDVYPAVDPSPSPSPDPSPSPSPVPSPVPSPDPSPSPSPVPSPVPSPDPSPSPSPVPSPDPSPSPSPDPSPSPSPVASPSPSPDASPSPSPDPSPSPSPDASPSPSPVPSPSPSPDASPSPSPDPSPSPSPDASPSPSPSPDASPSPSPDPSPSPSPDPSPSPSPDPSPSPSPLPSPSPSPPPADTQPPNGTVAIAGGAAFVNTDTVSLLITASDNSGPAGIQMCVDTVGTNCTGTWGPVISPYSFSLGNTDGLKTAYVYLQDAAGNAAAPIAASVTRDTTAPAGSLVINGGATFATAINASLAITASDAGVGGVTYCLSATPACAGAFAFAPLPAGPVAYNLTGTQGTQVVYLILQDALGNAATYNASIIFDTLPPTASVSITGGARFVRVFTVSVDIYAADMGLMAFAKAKAAKRLTAKAAAPTVRAKADPTMTMCVAAAAVGAPVPACTNFVPLAASATVALPAGDGAKSIYVWVQDAAGNTMPTPARASVTVDTAPPAVTSFGLFKDGPAVVASTSVQLRIRASDATSGVSKMCIATTPTPCAAFSDYAPTPWFTLPAGDGPKTLYLWLDDAAGNRLASPAQLVVTLDTQPPRITSFLINGGAQSVSNAAVTLTVAATDASPGLRMCVSNTANCNNGFQPFATSLPWTLSSGAGAKVVTIWVRDAAGNEAAASATTTLTGASGPSGTVVVNGGDAFAGSRNVKVTLSASGGNVFACVATARAFDMSQCNAWVKLNNWWPTVLDFSLVDPEGENLVRAVFRNGRNGANGPVASDTTTLDLTPPTLTPAAANFRVVSVTSSSAQLKFNTAAATDSASGVKKYVAVYRANQEPPVGCRTGGGGGDGGGWGGWQNGGGGGGSTSSAIVDNAGNVKAGWLAQRTTYFFRLCAVDGAGNVSPGVVMSATTPRQPR